MKQLQETGTGERECRIIRGDGEVRWISDRSHLIYDEHGMPVRIDGIASDITRRRQNEEQIRYQNAFQEMIAHMAKRFVGATAHNMDTFISDALDQIGVFFQVDRTSIVRSSADMTTATTTHEWHRVPGKYPSSPVREYPMETMPWYAEKILTERAVVELAGYRGNAGGGAQRTGTSSVPGIKSALTVPMYTERHVYGFIGVYTIERYEQWSPEQIRGLSVIAQILAQAFAGIDAETALIAMKEESVAAKEAAEAANHAKSDFLSSMSHELRTPAQRGPGICPDSGGRRDALSAEQADFTAEIRQAGQHLLELVNEVLDLSRIESGRIDLSLESVACGEVISEAISLITPLATKHGIRIEQPDLPDCTIQADRTRLKQVLVNLLSNAIKYNRPNGSVRVEMPAGGADTDTSAGKATRRITITDTGSGIPADRIDELFTKFNRLGRERGDIDGTGIGLALTKRLIDLMNGSIGVESTVGEGSTPFTSTCPLRPPVRESAHARTSAPYTARSRRRSAEPRRVLTITLQNRLTLRNFCVF